MTESNHEVIEALVRQIITGKLMPTKQMDPSGIMSIKLLEVDVTEDDRLNTGNPADIVYIKDLFSLGESPHLGCGLMAMKGTTLDWVLECDEIGCIISGQLDILTDGRKIPTAAGETTLILKSSKVQFSVTDGARFVYVTYPIDQQSQ